MAYEGLSDREQRFVTAFVFGAKPGNAAAAYCEAGYSHRYANANAARMTAKDSIATAIADATAERDAKIKAEGIANRQYRIDSQNRRHALIWQVIEARAADPEMAQVPGGSTGLLVRTYKQIGVGRDAETVEEYTVDTPTLKELRELEKQVPQDLGQWAEKREITGKDGAPLSLALIDAVTADANAHS